MFLSRMVSYISDFIMDLFEILSLISSTYKGHFTYESRASLLDSRRNAGFANRSTTRVTKYMYSTAWLSSVGKMASCMEFIRNTRFFMRPVQIYMLHNWNPQRMTMSHQVPITNNYTILHFNWWLQKANILRGRSVQ